MKKIILLSITMLLLLACETGVRNNEQTTKPVLSGIVDRSSVVQKTHKNSSTKIFSNSAQPGYYLQMAVFEKNRPNKTFLKPLEQSKFDYIVLNKANKDYVLIGAYKSYAAAKRQVTSVRRSLGKNTFVVQVLRP